MFWEIVIYEGFQVNCTFSEWNYIFATQPSRWVLENTIKKVYKVYLSSITYQIGSAELRLNWMQGANNDRAINPSSLM